MTAPAPSPPQRPEQDSLARVEAGGIPAEAERRLAALGENGGSYTSDLSTADFALCHQLGLRPLAQVMGSSIYQVGYQQSVGWMGLARGGMGGFSSGLITELDTLTDAWNEARERALGRLAREAQEVGADAVVGVQLRAEARDFGDASMSSGVIEYSVIGTAVRRGEREGRRGERERRRGEDVVLTELSVADYAKLLGAGIEPAGIVGWSSVCFAMYSYGTAMRAQPGLLLGGGETFELREFTQAVYAARERVMERVGAQAQSLHASGIVGVRLDHKIARQPLGAGANSGLSVTLHAIGTAVRETEHVAPAAPKCTIDLLA